MAWVFRSLKWSGVPTVSGQGAFDMKLKYMMDRIGRASRTEWLAVTFDVNELLPREIEKKRRDFASLERMKTEGDRKNGRDACLLLFLHFHR